MLDMSMSSAHFAPSCLQAALTQGAALSRCSLEAMAQEQSKVVEKTEASPDLDVVEVKAR